MTPTQSVPLVPACRAIGFPLWWVIFLDFTAPANDERFDPLSGQVPCAVIVESVSGDLTTTPE